jgi:hypothetical protein
MGSLQEQSLVISTQPDFCIKKELNSHIRFRFFATLRFHGIRLLLIYIFIYLHMLACYQIFTKALNLGIIRSFYGIISDTGYKYNKSPVLTGQPESSLEHLMTVEWHGLFCFACNATAIGMTPVQTHAQSKHASLKRNKNALEIASIARRITV